MAPGQHVTPQPARKPSHGTALEAVRFPRTAAVIESIETARALREAADELDRLAGEAHRYQPGTLRRSMRAVALTAVSRLVDLELL